MSAEAKIPTRSEFFEAGERACLIYSAADSVAALAAALGIPFDDLRDLGRRIHEDGLNTLGHDETGQAATTVHAYLLGILHGRELYA